MLFVLPLAAHRGEANFAAPRLLQTRGIHSHVKINACLITAGWPRPPQVALALAELHFNAFAQLAVSMPKKTTRALKHKLNSMLNAYAVNLGLFEAALLHSQSSGPSAAATADTPALLNTDASVGLSSGTPDSQYDVSSLELCQIQIRYHWLQASISEQRKLMEDAAAQLSACNLALAALAHASSMPQQHLSVATSTASGPVTATAVEQKIQQLKMLLMVENGRKSLDHGQHQELVAHLGPVLLPEGDAPPANMEAPQQLAGLRLLQVISTFRYAPHIAVDSPS